MPSFMCESLQTLSEHDVEIGCELCPDRTQTGHTQHPDSTQTAPRQDPDRTRTDREIETERLCRPNSWTKEDCYSSIFVIVVLQKEKRSIKKENTLLSSCLSADRPSMKQLDEGRLFLPRPGVYGSGSDVNKATHVKAKAKANAIAFKAKAKAAASKAKAKAKAGNLWPQAKAKASKAKAKAGNLWPQAKAKAAASKAKAKAKA